MIVFPEATKAEVEEHDYSWIKVAITRYTSGYVIDASDGFYDTDMISQGDDALDNGIYIPVEVIAAPGLYLVKDIRISGGELVQSPNGDDYSDIEISGTWEKLA